MWPSQPPLNRATWGRDFVNELLSSERGAAVWIGLTVRTDGRLGSPVRLRVRRKIAAWTVRPLLLHAHLVARIVFGIAIVVTMIGLATLLGVLEAFGRLVEGAARVGTRRLLLLHLLRAVLTVLDESVFVGLRRRDLMLSAIVLFKRRGRLEDFVRVASKGSY